MCINQKRQLNETGVLSIIDSMESSVISNIILNIKCIKFWNRNV